jgi:hypothetical protein
VAAKEIAVKKHVVRLSAEERERLETLIGRGRHPAQRLTKARIVLKADAGEAGEGWSDSQIASALDTRLATIARTPSSLSRKGSMLCSPASTRPPRPDPRIFDGAAEARLMPWPVRRRQRAARDGR